MHVNHSEAKPISQDGTRLNINRWEPDGGTIIAEVLILHGYMDHGARYRELAHRLAESQIATVALDYRGHGHAEGRRGFVKDWERYLDDVDVGLEALGGGVPRFILGHSNGGLLALDYLSRRPDPVVNGLVVTNPYLGLAMPVPAAKIFVGNLASRLLPKLAIPAGLLPSYISRDPEIVSSYERDPLVFTKATAGWFGEVSEAQERVRMLRRLPVPLLYVFSDADPVASPAHNRELAERLEVADKTVWERHGELHEVLNEIDRAALHADVAGWIAERAE